MTNNDYNHHDVLRERKPPPRLNLNKKWSGIQIQISGEGSGKVIRNLSKS